MVTTDPIADLLTRIRNAQSAGHDIISVPASKLKIGITHILKDEGFIQNYKCIRDNKQGLIKIALKYSNEGKPAISEIKRRSTSSRRIYVGAERIPFVRNGFGIGILSTSRGLMTDRDARKSKVGGEYLCSVY
jgi:small subunit ribosomal protein S8